MKKLSVLDYITTSIEMSMEAQASPELAARSVLLVLLGIDALHPDVKAQIQGERKTKCRRHPQRRTA